jgi:hypothetical protein
MSPRRKLVAVIGIFLVLGGSAYFAATHSIDRLIRSDGFLRFISEKTAEKLGVSECGYLPVARRGVSVHSAGIFAHGRPPHHLTTLSAANLHASCSLANLWQRTFTISRLQASHLGAAYGDAAATHLERLLPAEPELTVERKTETLLNIDIRETDIDQTDVYWGAAADDVGGLRAVRSHFFPKNHGLDIFGRGGTFQQAGWPELKVDELHFNWSAPKLIVKSAFLSLGQPRNINVTGGFDFGERGSMQLHVSTKQTPAEPFVIGYWKGRFQGVIDSESDLQKQFEPGAKVDAGGELIFSGAMVHNVQALAQIAAVTRHPQFEKPKIEILRFHYRLTGDRLEISKFEAEAKGLCRLEGEFTIENKMIDGKFKVGAAPDVVETLPGAREEVFTESRDGYLWTSLNLQGPASHPREDLKQRLIAAAQKHFAKGILAPLFKMGKPVTDLLQDIYK